MNNLNGTPRACSPTSVESPPCSPRYPPLVPPTPTDEPTSPSGETDMPPLNVWAFKTPSRAKLYRMLHGVDDPANHDELTAEHPADGTPRACSPTSVESPPCSPTMYPPLVPPTPTDEPTSPSGETDMPPLNVWAFKTPSRAKLYRMLHGVDDPANHDELTAEHPADGTPRACSPTSVESPPCSPTMYPPLVPPTPTTPEAHDSDAKRAFNQKRKREEEGVGFAVMTRKSPTDGPRESPTDGPPTPAYNALSPAYRFSGEPSDIPPAVLGRH